MATPLADKLAKAKSLTEGVYQQLPDGAGCASDLEQIIELLGICTDVVEAVEEAAL